MNIRIGHRLAAGFSVLVLLTVGIGILAERSTNQLSDMARKLYRQTLRQSISVAVAAKQASANDLSGQSERLRADVDSFIARIRVV